MMPGNPFLVNVTRGTDAQLEVYRQNVERYGLNDPIIITLSKKNLTLLQPALVATKT